MGVAIGGDHIPAGGDIGLRLQFEALVGYLPERAEYQAGGIDGHGLVLFRQMIGDRRKHDVGSGRLIFHAQLELLAFGGLQRFAGGGKLGNRIEGGGIAEEGRNAVVKGIECACLNGEGVLLHVFGHRPLPGLVHRVCRPPRVKRHLSSSIWSSA